MKDYSSKEILEILYKDGWQVKNVEGSHYQLTHPVKSGKVTVPHPKKSVPKRTAMSIFKQAGLRLP
ncbi:MAG: type II toxin-antitoxin system HicA family toxin [Bacillota bacterium]